MDVCVRGLLWLVSKIMIRWVGKNGPDTPYSESQFVHNYETNIKGLYAIGDIIGAPWLAHKAMHDAINCVTHISTGNNTHKPKENHIPGCIYSLPQIATVGFTEQQLKDNNIPYKTGNFPFLANGKSQTMSNSYGFVKTLFNSKK